MKTAGVAAGAAAISASPSLASAGGEPAAVEMLPSVPFPREPVIAIVRDAGGGEVTVLVGTTEKTYRDPYLAARLLKVARQNVPGAGLAGAA